MTRKAPKTSDIKEVNAFVGSKLKQRRIMLNMTQEQLGAAIGVSFQQIMKYEKGSSNLTVLKVMEICDALQVEAGYFFTGAPKPRRNAAANNTSNNNSKIRGTALTQKQLNEFLASKFGLRLIDGFLQLNKSHQHMIEANIRALQRKEK